MEIGEFIKPLRLDATLSILLIDSLAKVASLIHNLNDGSEIGFATGPPVPRMVEARAVSRLHIRIVRAFNGHIDMCIFGHNNSTSTNVR